VRAAFGVPAGPARRLPGGGGACWRVGDVVLKPGQDVAGGSWSADLFAGLSGPGFRVPRPVRAAGGGWIVDGWAAWTAVEGEPDPLGRWPELVAAARAFHAALAGVPAPGWLRRGRDRWAVADRVVWDGADIEVAPELTGLVAGLRAATRPVRLPHQLIHGDLAGNVLFAAERAPAVIDFSPSRRPAGYALAVAAVDLLAWHGAPAGILGELAGEDEIDQLLLRALRWRLITESLGRPDPESRRAVRRANEPVVDLLLSRVRGQPAGAGPPDLAGVAGRLIGAEITALRPVGGGHSAAIRRIAERAGAGPVFLKAGELDSEMAVYRALGARAFLPRLLASTQDPVPMLVLEALDAGGWAPEWTPPVVEATRRLLHEVHRLPPPAGVPRLGPAFNPWTAIAADPQRLLRLDVCSERWLTRHLDDLAAAAGAARAEGDSLIHRDVCAANLWHHDGRLVLADWASAAIGDPWLDHHLWIVACHAEGGPVPDSVQGPHATGHAALIAGQQPLLTPARDAGPVLFDQRRRRLRVALAWAARLLCLPPP
jgi:uncharacterized protein (TIGR02569 family)